MQEVKDSSKIPSMKILVVDDSKTTLEIVREILTLHKHIVETAENGAQALDIYEKFRPDLVVLDQVMPIIDGYETLRKILCVDKNANILMMTSSEQYDVLEKCLNMGAMGCIIKPFTASELTATITNTWRGSADKNVVTLFSLIHNKITSSIIKLLGPDVSVSLIDLKVIRQEISLQISSYQNVGNIRCVSNVSKELAIEAPNDSIGYVTEIAGQQNGMIVSFIKKEDIITIFNKDGVNLCNTDKPVEFFDIINTKVLSELANVTHLRLKSEPTKLYFDKNEKAPAKAVTKAIFEIDTGQKKAQFEMQLWINTGKIFREAF